MNYLCFDVGGTFVKYAVLTDEGQFLTKGKMPTNHEEKIFFTSLADCYFTAKNNFQIEGIGLSFPGFINPESGEALLAGALANLHGANIIELLAKEINHEVPIKIENDANCAALAELAKGNAQDVADFLLITLGTGIGGAIVENREIIHGAGFRAGEFGMMITNFSDSGYQTLHDFASTRALVDQYRQFYQISAEQEISGEEIFADERLTTKEILRNWSRYVAIAIFNTVTTLNPQKVLLGGGVSQNPQLVPLVEAALQENPHWPDFSVVVEKCFYSNDAGLLGALYLISKERKG
ncbi:ROK family protein [Enterococcus sp. LJL90]